MLYAFLKIALRFTLSVYYRRIQALGLANIPKSGPIILACSHPNSFLDAIIMGVLSPRPLHFLARSDVFNAPWKRWILKKMHLLPIYRLQEGSENLHKNESTFEACYQLLEAGGAILIFAEGISLSDRLLRPLKKGMARIAFGAEERNAFQLGVQIIPIGINYQEALYFRNKVLVGVAPPIKLSDFTASYQKHANQAYLSLNQAVYEAIQSQSIIANEKTQDCLEQVLKLWRTQAPDKSMKEELLISHRLLHISETNENQFQQLSQACLAFDQDSKTLGLEKWPYAPHSTASFFSFLFIMISLPLYAFAFLLIGLPFYIAHQIAENKVREVEFYAAVKLSSGALLFLIWASLLSGISISYWAFWGLLTPFLLYLCGRFMLFYRALRDQLNYHRHLRWLQSHRASDYNKWLEFRQQLLEQIQSISDD